MEGSLFPQTTYIYRCSNKECQDKKDKEEKQRVELFKKKKRADEDRLKLKQEERNKKIEATLKKKS